VDITSFEQLWVEKHEDSYRDADPSCWDNRVQEFNRNKPDERINLITDFLLQKRMLTKASTVLDIGCGPGKFALEFAKTAQYVIGVDIAPKMIQAARENSSKQRFSNVEFVELDWQKVDLAALEWSKKFDLITAIMSPAINNKENLDKMIQASKGYCLICHFLERFDSVGDELQKHVFGQKKEDKYGNRGLYCLFNILWLAKLYPEIHYVSSDRQVNRTVEEAYHHYVNRFRARTELTPTEKSLIKDFLEEKSTAGLINERIRSKMAFVYWKNS